MNKKYLVIGVAVAVLLIILFAYPKFKGDQKSYSGSVPCLLANLSLIRHWHPHLTVFIDGKEQAIPANIGLSGNCERALHTHTPDGVIHLESQVIRDYTLGEFFEVWGEPIQKDGYQLEMTVDGQPNKEPGNLSLKDGQQIVLKYQKQ